MHIALLPAIDRMDAIRHLRVARPAPLSLKDKLGKSVITSSCSQPSSPAATNCNVRLEINDKPMIHIHKLFDPSCSSHEMILPCKNLKFKISQLASTLVCQTGFSSQILSLARMHIPDTVDMTDLKKKLESASDETSEEAVEKIYRELTIGETSSDAESVKVKEEALQKLCDLKVQQKDAAGLRHLLTELRPLFAKFPKAKTAKMVRNLIDAISRVPDSTELQVVAPTLERHYVFTHYRNAVSFQAKALIQINLFISHAKSRQNFLATMSICSDAMMDFAA